MAKGLRRAAASAGLRVGLLAMAAVAGGATTPAGAGGQEPLTWPEFRALDPLAPDQVIRWGTGPDAVGELYLPEGAGPHPVAVVVHGGCWQAIADRTYMSHLARALTTAGWAAWSLEFRRIDQEGGAWPATLSDVAAGADHLAVVAAEHPLDLERVVTVGHSSGGHLALWLAARAGLPDDSVGRPLGGAAPLPVAGVVALAAVADLEDFHHRRDRGCGDDVVTRFLGGDPLMLADRLDVASPGRRLPLAVPQLLVTGALDRTVPPAHGEQWVAAARAAGDDARLLIAPGAGHFEVVAPWTAPFAAVWTEVRAFLDSLSTAPGDTLR